MELPRFIYFGTLAGILTLTTACTKDPVVQRINDSGQQIADMFHNGQIVPKSPDPRLVDGLRESTQQLKGGFRMAIKSAGSVLLRRPEVETATYSCINEVAAATRIGSDRLRQISEEEGAYLLRMVVDAGVSIAYRHGRTVPDECPYIPANP